MVKLPENYDFHHLGTVDSTNEEARRQVAAGFEASSKPLWISAERQTAGRGRLGRKWTSPSGNLMCSLLIAPKMPSKNLAEIGFVAGLALYDAVRMMIPEAKLSLKWPNDVLLEGAKVSGILIESLDNKQELLAVGIGLNLMHFPDDTPYPAISVKAASGQIFTVNVALAHLASRFDIWLNKWQADGFKALHKAWRERAHGLGEKIKVNLPTGELEGVFDDLSMDGQLVLINQSGTHKISAGDVFFNKKGMNEHR